MKRAIITGGTGLIGRALAAELASADYDVIVLTRNLEKATGFPVGVRAEEYDARSGESWASLITSETAIINLAGASIGPDGVLGLIGWRWTPTNKKIILQSRLNAGNAVVEAIKAASEKPEVVVQSSAIGYYGPHGDEMITEETPPGEDFQAEVCKQWEAATAEVEEMGIRQVVLRTGIVMSPDGGVLPILALPVRLFVGGPIGSGKQWLSWIHIKDEVRAIRHLIEDESASGPYNLTAPNPMTNGGFTRVVGSTLSRPTFLPAPGFAFKIAFGEAATLVLDGARVLPKRLENAGFEFEYPDAGPALEDLLG
ncbi:MAG: TIGR01777 family protein [Chloroflexi bacterium]|nr:TIGR01777 family protein [Chloroflexota bacterium]